VLQDLNLIVTKGASIGIVGKTGTGQSTLIDIILGILEPSKGEILVDGINIKNNLNAWQNLLAYVPQNFSLVDDTLISNIAFGVLPNEVNLQRVMYAIRLSQLDSFVSNLPEGVDTIIGERGARLSGGQKQRIGIARALYRDSQVLILDEPTSALDNESEIQVLEELRKMASSKILLVVSHSEKVMSYADSVINLVDGVKTELTLP
jgi:ABC-type bacteriocin/lantibiotic exporter with double-glycine peptidase domain